MAELDEELAQATIAGGVVEDALGGVAVAPGAARLLVVGLDRLRQVVVDDEADIGLVDAESEGVGRDDDAQAIAGEGVLDADAVLFWHAGVVASAADAAALEGFGEGLDALAGGTVDDGGGFPAEGLEQLGDVLELLLLAANADGVEAQVGTVEAGDAHVRLVQAEALDDVVADERVGGGGEGDDGGIAEAGAGGAEVAVAGAEVVAPLGDAVRLVDREEGDIDAAEPRDEATVGEALGRDVEEAEIALGGAAEDGGLLIAGNGRVDGGGGDAVAGEGVDLVLHQGEERGDDEGEAIEEEGGELVADALAAAGGEHGEGVAPGEHGGDDLGLAGEELAVAEDLAELLAGGGEGAGVVVKGGRGGGRGRHVAQSRTFERKAGKWATSG